MRNPFQPTKFEWEKRPVIWLSGRAKSLLNTIKPVYISGSRGSGKTTILQSLATRQFSRDQNLRDQFGKRRITWFGQYLQFNKTFQEKTDHLASKLRDEGDEQDVSQKLFHSYFEFSLLHHFLEDVTIFQEEGFLHFKSKSERAACEELSALFQNCRWTNNKKIEDFQDARRLLREVRQEFLKTTSSLDIDGLKEAINMLAPGTLVNFIKDNALKAVQSSHFKRGAELDFFILLDDCENLSDRQQVALNSYIRLTEGSAKWVICYLSDRFNTTDTYLKNTTLTKDDRRILPLNDLTESQFSEFCEQVANLRLSKFFEQMGIEFRDNQPRLFSFDRTFGRTSYNQLIDIVIAESQKQSLLDFRRSVETTRTVLQRHLKKKLHSRFHCEQGQNPYVEHIVIDALGLAVKNYALPEEQESLAKTIDGKQAAAYIGFCHDFRLKPVYSGGNYFRAISDNCIRDFLDAMAEVFDVLVGGKETSVTTSKARRVAAQFYADKGPIVWRTQNKAIHEASDGKVLGLDELKASEPHLRRLVLSLANLQREFEHDTENWTSVKAPVRGRFAVTLPPALSPEHVLQFELAHLRSLLERLEYDRYLRIKETDTAEGSEEIIFTVHRRLRPSFRCGHSGPYDPIIRLSPIWLLQAANGEDDFDPVLWARNVYRTLQQNDQSINTLQRELPL